MASPDTIFGSHWRFCCLGSERKQIGRDEIGMDQKARAARAGAPQFLEHDHVEEVVEPHAAVLLRHGTAEQALGARLEPELPRHDAVFLPLGMKWHNFPIDKAPYRFPENVVFFTENGSFDHRGGPI